jgi:uncharacterized Fe-S center protein
MSDSRIESHEERLYVLRDKAAREGFSVPDDALDYIAEKYALETTLKGALINVAAYAARRRVPIDRAIAALVLDGVRPKPEPAVVSDEAIDQTVPEPLEGFEDVMQDIIPVDVPISEELDSASAGSAEEYPFEPTYGTLFADVTSVRPEPAPTPEPHAPVIDEPELPPFVSAPAPTVVWEPEPASEPAPVPEPAAPASPGPATVWFAPMRSVKKESLVKRAGKLLKCAGLESVIAEGDLVAVKLHFGEEGNTGFVQPIFLREVVRRVKKYGGKAFLTDSNTLYRGKRANAVDHIGCAIHNGFAFATVDAPVVIADGLTGADGIEVPIEGFLHFDSVKIGAAVVHSDAMVVVTHVKGHEATGFGGAIKNVGMGLGTRAAKQRMHSDLKPQVNAEKCTGCKRCVKSCPVDAIRMVDHIAVIDYELCYGCGECVAACPYGAIGIQWKTEPDAIQEKIVEHCAGALAGKEGKVIYLSFVVNVSPDCDCWDFSDASVVPDIGVLASTDLVAIDQAAYDLVVAARGLPGSRGEGLVQGTDKFREITGIDGTIAMSYAEETGLGTRAYVLKTLE